jgi:predicted 2-oxoglutarate/Fe(II)-dependent dioxygenase YbiX
VKLEVSVHEEHDIVGHIPTFLSDAEIEELYEINKHRKWPYAATRWSGYNSKIRKCKKRSRIEFPLYDRLKKAVDLYNNNTYKFHLYDERKRHEINMVRYDEPGMHFRAHRDYRPGLKEIHTGMTTRKISLSIQLSNSDEYEGGDLEIVESYTTPDAFVDSNYPPDF